jgi:3-deoxy-D-manno-octulosonic-acid transferase
LNSLKTTSQKKYIILRKAGENLADFDVFNRHHRYSNSIVMQTSLLWVVVLGILAFITYFTFGVPIIVGPNYSHFAEAIALVNMGGCISVSNKAELNAALKDLITDANFRTKRSYLQHFCSDEQRPQISS